MVQHIAFFKIVAGQPFPQVEHSLDHVATMGNLPDF
jgi:hypothetical protein